MLFSLAMFPVGGGDSLVEPVSEVIDEIDRVKSHSVCKKWSGSCGGLLPLRQVSEALVRLL